MRLRQRTLVVGAAIIAVVAIATAAALTIMSREQPAVTPPSASRGTLESRNATFTPFAEELQPSGLGAVTVTPREPTQPLEFQVNAAMAHVRALEHYGVREAGSDAETQAAQYLADRLSTFGLEPRIEEFALPNGAVSRNVVARIPGASDKVVVLGAHFDTISPSPGANDNGSGCGILLDLARILSAQPVAATVEVVFFGAEERVGSNPDDHHFGSRYRVSQMTPDELASTAGMISIDMVGFGPEFHTRTMGRGPMRLSNIMLDRARALGIRLTYRRDPGSTGWSDHEPYELAGIPVSWLEWRDDPVYHTAGDVAAHLQPDRLDKTGRLVLDVMRNLDETELQSLAAR